jgi:hypothetical protein
MAKLSPPAPIKKSVRAVLCVHPGRSLRTALFYRFIDLLLGAALNQTVRLRVA